MHSIYSGDHPLSFDGEHLVHDDAEPGTIARRETSSAAGRCRV